MTTEKKRIEWIDLAKGVCITLVVLSHCGVYASMLNYVRMPLYFIISGLFFKDYGSLQNLFIKKTNKLLIPFLFFYIIMCLLITLYGIVQNADIQAIIRGGHFVELFTSLRCVNSPLWFLLCLFWLNILYFFVSNKSFFVQILYVALSATIGGCLWKYKIVLPLHLTTALCALPYFWFGSILKKTQLLYPTKYDIYNIPIAIITFAIIYVCCRRIAPYGGILSWNDNKLYGSLWQFIIYSIPLTICSMMVCKQIKHIPILSYFGKYSLIILGMHWPVLFFLNMLPYFAETSTISCFIKFALTMTICGIFIPILKRWFPYFTAQKDPIQISSN